MRNQFVVALIVLTLIGCASSGPSSSERAGQVVAAVVSQQPAATPVNPGEEVALSCSTTLSIVITDTHEILVKCAPAAEASPTPTATAEPSSTAAPSATAAPTATSVPAATNTAVPPTPSPTVPPSGAGPGIWISPAELAALPTSGAAWQKVLSAANSSWGLPNLSDLNSNHDVLTLAGAYVCARTGAVATCDKTRAGLRAAVGTEGSSRGLEVSRNITSYVVAADVIGFREQAWVDWLSALRTKKMTDGRTIISTHEDRPNNWGTMAAAARIAIDAYLDDAQDLDRAATVFRGWVGDRSAYSDFDYAELDWQCSPTAPVGINPLGCFKQGLNIDGVLPDDQRRTGGFTTSPPCGSYPFEALQGVTVAAQLLHRAGYPAWHWENEAIRRAYVWLETVPLNGGCFSNGDDSLYPFLVNNAYGTSFRVGDPSRSYGKNMGYMDWTHP